MKPAAKQSDTVVAVDTHLVVILGVPTPLPSPFNGPLVSGLSQDVFVENMPAAVQGSQAQNTVPHIPVGGPFAKPPSNIATLTSGSSTVFMNGKPAGRVGDPVATCNDPVDLPIGTIVGMSTILIGG